MTMTIQSIPVGDIVIDEALDFRSQGGDVTELAASIKAYGLMQPITIAPNPDGGFQVVAGRRRLRAVIELGEGTIDAIVRDDLDDQAQVIGQIIENLQREDVGILDEARAFAQLGEYGMKQKDVATACGVSPAHVSGRLALLKLDPALLKRVEEGKLPQSLAVKIARLPKAARDALGTGPISDYDVSRAERNHEEAKAIEGLMKQLAEATGLPVAGRMPGGTYASVDAMAAECGLTDEDKPKSHSWDIGGRVHRSDAPDDEAFLAALTGAKAKGLYVQSAGAHATVVLIDSANVDKERKAEQERQRQLAEEREAEAQAVQAAFDDSLAPLLASPDKSAVLAMLLGDAIEEHLAGWNAEPRLRRTCARLGISVPDDADQDDIDALLKGHAAKSVTDSVRVLLALQTGVTDLLVGLGFLDTFPTEHLAVHAQLNYYREGKLPRERLTADAEIRLANEEAAEAEAEDLDEAVEAEVERRVQEHLESEDVDVEGITDDELAAITSEIRGAVEADLEAGHFSEAEDGGEEE